MLATVPRVRLRFSTALLERRKREKGRPAPLQPARVRSLAAAQQSKSAAATLSWLPAPKRCALLVLALILMLVTAH